MKKLSLIMVLALVLTAFTAMLVMNTSAAADDNAPASVSMIALGSTNVNYKLYSFCCDECAVNGRTTHGGSDDETVRAIGRFTKEGGNGYAAVWSAVGGNSSSCGASVFYLINDYSGQAAFDIGGRPLTIDGSLGQSRTGEKAGKNFEVTYTGRVLNVTQKNTAAHLTLKNVTFSNTSDNANSGGVQVNSGKITLDTGAVINSASVTAIILGAGAECTMEIKAGAELNFTANKTTGITFSNYPCTLNMIGGEINATGTDSSGVYTSYLGSAASKGSTINVSGGTISGVNCGIYEAIGGNTINITGGTVSGTSYGINVTAAGSTITVGAKGDATAAANDKSGVTDATKKGTKGIVTGSSTRAIRLAAATTVNIENGAYVHCAGNQAVIFEAANSVLNINGGHVEGNIVIGANKYGTININGGYVTKTSTADQGLVRPTTEGVKINISGGVISCNGTNLWSDGNTAGSRGDITVSGGTIKSNGNVFKATNGGGFNLTITGGEFTGTKLLGLATSGLVNVDISGGTITTSSNTIELGGKHATFTADKHKVINISGGTFTSTGGSAIYSSESRTDETVSSVTTVKYRPYTEINISGGTFATTGANKSVIHQMNDNAGKVIRITGGTFKAMNITNDLTELVVGGTTSPSIASVLWASGDKIYVYGGDFYIYDGNGALSGESAHGFSFGGGAVNICGGRYNGGECLVVAAGTSAYSAIKDTATKCHKMPASKIVDLNITVQQGASVRTVEGSAGIRFQGVITQTAIDFVTSYYGSDVIRGVAITTAENLAAAGGDFNVDALYAAGGLYASTNSKLGWIANKDGTYTARLALTGLTDYAQKYVAVAFVAYDADKSGTLTTGDKAIYSSTTSGERSIGEVAAVALADVKDTAGRYNGVYYGTEVTVGDVVKYSRYTTKQLAILDTFA